jgi:hypothetical protein
VAGSAEATTVTGTVRGEVNGVPIDGTLSGSGDRSTGFTTATFTGISPDEYKQVAPALQTRSCRLLAKTTAPGVKNLLDIAPTGVMTTTIRYPGCLTCILNHHWTWNYVAATDTLTIDTVYSGTAPALPNVNPLSVGPFQELWTQVAPGVIRGSIPDFVYTDASGTVHSSWETIINYNPALPGLNGNQLRSTGSNTRAYDGANVATTSAVTTLSFAPAASVPVLPAAALLGLGAAVVMIGSVMIYRRR